MAENIENNQEQLDENHLIAIRKEKLRELQEQGKDPFKVTKYNNALLFSNFSFKHSNYILLVDQY